MPRLIEPQADSATNARWSRYMCWLVIVLGALVILSHFVLILGAGWGGDEYANFASFRVGGLAALATRMIHWSPRPSSEVPLYVYSVAIEQFKAPLITPFLAGLWALLFGGTALAAWHRGTPGTAPRLALAIAALAMFFLGRQISVLFYWPMGAAPYLLALTGIAITTFQILGGRTALPSGRLVCCLALSLTVTSSEVGLFFVAGFTIPLAILEAPRLLRTPLRFWSSDAWHLIVLAEMILVAAWVAYIVIGNPGRGIATSGEFHSFSSSLIATLQGIPRELVLGDGTPAGVSGPISLLIGLLLFIGFVWGCRAGLNGPLPWRPVVALLFGLGGCFGLSILAGYYEYSTQWHEPHNSFRHCLLILMLLVVARVVSFAWPAERVWAVIGPAALAAAVLAAAIPRAPGLMSDYRLLPTIRQAREQTWLMGIDPSVHTVRFIVAPQGEVLLGLIPWTMGTFTEGGANTEWWMGGIMRFFGKQAMEIVPPPNQH